MTTSKTSNRSLDVIILLLVLVILLIVYDSISIKKETLEGFTVVFLSIILEAIPFVMIGAFVSSIIQIFVSEKTISRIIPKNKVVGLLVASLMGIIFPVCECAIVPIVRRLIKKGVPLHIAVTFMMAVPIVNPVVLASTYYAFAGQTYMVFLRGFLGFVASILIGYIISIIHNKANPLKAMPHEHHHTHSHSCDSCHHHDKPNSRKNILSTAYDVIMHTGHELKHVGKFLIIGAFLSALMQTFVDRNLLLSIGQSNISSILVMMTLAFVLSLCSVADAFVASTFVGQFTNGSIVAFLIFGPMIDIKNTLMLNSSFKIKFIIKLISVIFIVCFILALIVSILGV
jgi:uncharacterized membrane protein YraQ (UPF0718 family)